MTLETHGFCPHCKRFIRLTKAGALWHHGGPLGTGYARGGRSRAWRCVGASGKPALLLTGITDKGTDVTGALVQIKNVRRVVLRSAEVGDVEVDTETLAPSGELTR